MSYQEILNSHKAELLRLKSDRVPIDLDDVFAPVDWEQVAINKPFLAFLTSDRIASRKDVEVARGRALAKRTLGVSPRTCCEFVGAYLTAHRVTASFGGTVRAADMRTGVIREVTLEELKEDMRVMAVELALPVQRESINDACNQWFRGARQARVEAIRSTLDGDTEFDWIGLAEACFDSAETSPAFAAAILRKFVHQTKLKLAGRTVGHHLMPVLTGVQGCGKTSFIESLVSPVSELSRDADFRMLADDRNIALWRSYVLVIDEMAYAERSDIEVVKHVITARALDRRPMRSNDVVTIKQQATLIGASNKSFFGGADGMAASYCETLSSRVSTLINSRELECLFRTGGDSLVNELEAFFADDERDVALISFKEVRFEHNTREVLLNIIGRYLLSIAREGRFCDEPVIVFLDEAHQFLGRTIGDEYASVRLDAFGLIAKEGRKYGLTCVLATQRPRDVPQDVLSQLGTLIVHRLTNEQDRATVEHACGDLDRAATQFVPMLAAGEAIIIGPDLPIPLPLKMTRPISPPNSKGPKFQEYWTQRKEL